MVFQWKFWIVFPCFAPRLHSPASPASMACQSLLRYFCKSFVETAWKNVKLHCHLPQVIARVTGHAAITMSTDGSQFISDYHKQFDICFIVAVLILFHFFCRLFVRVLKVTSNSAITKRQLTKIIGLVMQCCSFTSFVCIKKISNANVTILDHLCLSKQIAVRIVSKTVDLVMKGNFVIQKSVLFKRHIFQFCRVTSFIDKNLK